MASKSLEWIQRFVAEDLWKTPCRKHLEDKGCDSMRFPCPGFMEILSFSPKYSYITWLGLASQYPTCTVVLQSHVPSGKKRSGRDRQGRHETILAIPFLRNRDDYQGWIIGEQQCHPDNSAWELQHFGEKMPVSWWLWWISRMTSAPLNLNTVTYHRIHIRCVKTPQLLFFQHGMCLYIDAVSLDLRKGPGNWRVQKKNTSIGTEVAFGFPWQQRGWWVGVQNGGSFKSAYRLTVMKGIERLTHAKSSHRKEKGSQP